MEDSQAKTMAGVRSGKSPCLELKSEVVLQGWDNTSHLGLETNTSAVPAGCRMETCCCLVLREGSSPWRFLLMAQLLPGEMWAL